MALLLRQLLVALNKSERRYTITNLGKLVLSLARQIKENDTEISLSKKILKEEHRIYPEAIELFARKKIKVSGRKAHIS